MYPLAAYVGDKYSEIGTFGLQGAIAALHVAVLSRAMRVEEEVLGVQFVDDGSDVSAQR